MNNQSSFYAEVPHEEAVRMKELLVAKGYHPISNTGSAPWNCLRVTKGHVWLTKVAIAGTVEYHFPQDQATVYNLLNLPLPNNMQQEFKVGDKVRVVKDTGVTLEYVGKTGTIFKLNNGTDGDQYPYYVKFNNNDERQYASNELVLASTPDTIQADTIYLSGTPGQLEGFRQDWVKAGNTYSNIIDGEFIRITFPKDKPAYMWTVSTGPQEGVITSVLEHWQTLLDRAAQHVKKQNVAPVKIAGHEVKLEDGKVIIGCRKQMGKQNFINMVQGIALLNAEGARIENIRTEDGHAIMVKDLIQIRDWLLEKK